MDPTTHLRLHQADGSIYLGGMNLNVLDIDNNSPDAGSLEFTITEGYSKDEDIPHIITQKLVTDTIREYALIGATGNLRRQSENIYGLSSGVGGYIQYNLFNGSTWSLAQANSGSFVWRHIYAVPEIEKNRTNYVSIMGNSQYLSQEDAELAVGNEIALLESRITVAEYIHCYAILYETKSNYINSYKARIISINDGGQALDYRTVKSTGTSTSVASSHIALSGRDLINSHPAAAISFVPYLTLEALNVSDAIKELHDDSNTHIADVANPHAVTTGQIGAVDLTTNQTIAGLKTFSNNATFNGTLYINGDIIQAGAAYETNAEKITSTKDFIVMREGNISALGAGEFTGFQFTKYDGTNDGQLVVDVSGTARVGDVGSTQPILTRDENVNLVNLDILV